jgi:hypothetical protein
MVAAADQTPVFGAADGAREGWAEAPGDAAFDGEAGGWLAGGEETLGGWTGLPQAATRIAVTAATAKDRRAAFMA